MPLPAFYSRMTQTRYKPAVLVFFHIIMMLAAPALTRAAGQTAAGAGVAAAPQTLSLTLETCIERALATSLALRKNAIDLNTSRLTAVNLWSELFPAISVGAQVSYADSFSNPGRQGSGLNYEVPVSVSLSLAGTLPVTMKLSKLAYETRLIDWETARRSLANAVSKQFYTLLVEAENIALLAETLAVTEARLAKDETQFRSGLSSESSVLQSRLNLETARYQLNKAMRDRQANVTAFLTDAGFNDEEITGKSIQFQGWIEIEEYELDADALIAAYVPARPDMVKAVKTVETAELNALQRSLTARGPALALRGTYSGSILSGNLNAGTTAPLSDSLSAGLSVTIPLDGWIPNTKPAQSVAQAKAEVEKARLDLASVERNARSTIRLIVENMTNTLSSIKIAELRVDIAGRNYRMAEAAFERGVMERLDYENVRTSWDQARKALLDERLKYRNLILDLEAALNVDALAQIQGSIG